MIYLIGWAITWIALFICHERHFMQNPEEAEHWVINAIGSGFLSAGWPMIWLFLVIGCPFYLTHKALKGAKTT